VQPKEDRAYTLFVQPEDRSGYARGTLAPRPGMTAPIPPMDPRPMRTMADMGMGGMDHGSMSGMDMGSMGNMPMNHGSMQHGSIPGMDMGSMAKVRGERLLECRKAQAPRWRALRLPIF
jgi:FtsP/CotA-like multicopper oxidase with cupredoxin domain